MTAWLFRVLLIAGLLGSAAVHLIVWLDWARATPIIGPLFLVNVAAGVVIAIAVLVWRHWLPVLAGIAFGAGTLAAYVMSLTVGLFGVHEQFATSAEVWGVVTEVTCVVAGGVLLLGGRWRAA